MSSDTFNDSQSDPDLVMVKADALIYRHQNRSLAGLDGDLPMLDEIVGEDLPLLDDVAEPPVSLPAAQAAAPQPIDSRLKELATRHAEELAALKAERDALSARLASAEQAIAETERDASARKMQFAEHLIAFDAFLAQAIEAWMGRELPQIVAGELEGFRDRIRERTLAHLHATLVPELSARLSEALEASTRGEGQSQS